MKNLYSLSGAALQSIHVIYSLPPSATQPCTSRRCNRPNFFINNLHVHNVHVHVDNCPFLHKIVYILTSVHLSCHYNHRDCRQNLTFLTFHLNATLQPTSQKKKYIFCIAWLFFVFPIAFGWWLVSRLVGAVVLRKTKKTSFLEFLTNLWMAYFYVKHFATQGVKYLA